MGEVRKGGVWRVGKAGNIWPNKSYVLLGKISEKASFFWTSSKREGGGGGVVTE